MYDEIIYEWSSSKARLVESIGVISLVHPLLTTCTIWNYN